MGLFLTVFGVFAVLIALMAIGVMMGDVRSLGVVVVLAASMEKKVSVRSAVEIQIGAMRPSMPRVWSVFRFVMRHVRG